MGDSLANALVKKPNSISLILIFQDLEGIGIFVLIVFWTIALKCFEEENLK